MGEAEEEFGCDICWPASAEAAYGALRKLQTVSDLTDESHFIVRVVACQSCGQRFLTVFTEMIDWEDGEDPCSRRRLPLTERQAQMLWKEPSEELLTAIAPSRKCLAFDWPKGGAKSVRWVQGLQILPHD